jgi:hypothetical protein
MKQIIVVLAVLMGSISAGMADDLHISLSPNPASTHVNISFAEPVHGPFTVEVYNVLGTRISTERIEQPEGTKVYTINTNSLSEGFYLIRVTHGRESTVKRVKIQRD